MGYRPIHYQLRPNKAIERNLFIELLTLINREISLGKHIYIGFGGLFFEDFKAVHSCIDINDMISLESDTKLSQRQKFNSPYSCIRCENKKSIDFFSESSELSTKSVVIWLDYTSFGDIHTQLDEIRYIVGKLTHGDVLKVTLNTNMSNLYDGDVNPDNITDDDRKRMVAKLKEMLQEFFDESISPNDMLSKKFSRAICNCLKIAIKKGMEGPNKTIFQPLSCFVYADGQQMLTLTGIVLNTTQTDRFIRNSDIEKWEFKRLDWDDEPIRISAPVLTLIERVNIEKKMPNGDFESVKTEFDFINVTELEDYIRYYKHYPHYLRVMV